MTSLVWEIELTGTDDFEIAVVPELQSVYLADQSDIGTTTRLKLRRFDMTSGQALAEFPMRACVNAVSFSPDHSTILANSNKRIYLLDSKTLKEISRWDSRVPSCMTSIVQVNRDVAMKDRIGKKICLYNLDASSVAQSDESALLANGFSVGPVHNVIDCYYMSRTALHLRKPADIEDSNGSE